MDGGGEVRPTSCLVGKGRAQEGWRQSALSRAAGGGGAGEGLPVGNRGDFSCCGSGERGTLVASHATVASAWVSRAVATAVSTRGERGGVTMVGGRCRS